MNISFGRGNGKNSLMGGILFGGGLFFGSFVLLWWNEGNAVAQFRTIDDLEANTVEVSDTEIDSALHGMPVYLSAGADTEVELKDEVFDVSQVALRLRRIAEMYQWEEDEDRDSDTDRVTYSYDRVWSQKRIDSGGFNDKSKKNPGSMPYRTENWIPGLVTLGAVRTLPKFLIEDLDEFEALDVEGAEPEIEGLKRNGGGFYLGGNPGSPEIGDVRISFKVVLPGVVSLIAAQRMEGFERWKSPRTEREIHKIMHGFQTKEAIIQKLVNEARLQMWLIRGGGFLAMFIGLLVLTRPITMLARWIPLLGSMVQSGVAVVAFLVAGILSLTTVVVAWIAHRPMVGGVLLVVVAGLVYLLVVRVRKGKREEVG
ncbi:MAG: TMEM43 family protein, partial [Verrucomicrobiales bacterium]|nr:TMEM43 family protein [Verrucomicrobiales bacterium]